MDPMVTTAPHPADERVSPSATTAPAVLPSPVVPPVPLAIRPSVHAVEGVPTPGLAPAPVARPIRRPLPGDRERGELDLAHRIALADRIAALVLDAERHHRGDTPPARAGRAQVKDARGRLLDLDHALRSGITITRRGERLIERLLAGVTVGTYVGHGPRALHDDAEAACLAIGSVTPFH